MSSLATHEISKLWLVSVAEQIGLSLTWSETLKTDFLCVLAHLYVPCHEKNCIGVSDKVSFKPACSVTETSYKSEILLKASPDMMLSNNQITKAPISLHIREGWSAPLLFANPHKTGFLALRPI